MATSHSVRTARRPFRPHIELLEERITPAKFEVVSQPDVAPGGAMVGSMSYDDANSTWTGDWQIVKEGGDWEDDSPTFHGEGTFGVSGSLTIKVIPDSINPEPEGTEVNVTIQSQGDIYWDLDSETFELKPPDETFPVWYYDVAYTVNHVDLRAGFAADSETSFSLSGGLEDPYDHAWATAHDSGFGQKVINTTVGETFQIFITANGRSDAWESTTGHLHGRVQAQVSVQMQAEVAPGVSVKASHDDAGTQTDKVFGTYISGVKLPTDFTATVTNLPDVTRVRMKIGSTVLPAVPYDQNGTVFKFDPGLLKAGNHTLTVSYFNKFNTKVWEDYVGTIKVMDKLALSLQADVPGQGLVDASKLRLIAGAVGAPTLQFTATLASLPLAADYGNKFAVQFIDRTTNLQAFKTPVTFVNNTTDFSVSTGFFKNTVAPTTILKNGVTTTLFDYDVFLVPIIGSTSPVKRLNLVTDTTTHLFVVARPAWLKGGTWNYVENSAAIDAIWSGDSAGYVFERTVGATLNLPTTTETPFGLFDDLASNLSAKSHVFLYARLTGNDGDAALRVGNLDFKVKILGNQLVNKSLTQAETGLVVTANLNAWTLGGTTSLVLATSTAFDLKSQIPPFQRSFGDGKTDGVPPWKVKVSVPLPMTGGLLSATTNFFLKGTFSAEFDTFSVSTSLRYDIGADGSVAMNFPQSWIQLDTSASATLAFDGGAVLSLAWTPNPSLGIDLARISIKGEVDLYLDTSVRANFQATGASKVSKTAGFYAGLEVGVALKYTLDFLPSGDPDENTFADLFEPTTKKLALYGLPLPPP